MSDPGSATVRSIAELVSEVPVLTGDTHVDARENTWSISRARDDVADVAQLAAAITEVRDAWCKSARGGGGATFYAWYDEQSGRLMVSLSAQPPEALPFTADVRLVDLTTVLGSFVADESPGAISWDELAASPQSGDAEHESLAEVTVWAGRCPR